MMKKAVVTVLAMLVCLPVKGQLLSQESVGTAAIGGLIGGIIGHNSGRRTAEGIGIGAGAGLLLGALSHNARRDAYAYPPAPVYGPAYGYPSAYAHDRPHYGASGAVLGGVAGGIIGHNSGRRTMEGIAIGAGSGLVLGSIAEQAARRREAQTAYPVHPGYSGYPRYVVSSGAALPYTRPAPAPAPSQPAEVQTGRLAQSAPAHSMSGANALFGRE